MILCEWHALEWGYDGIIVHRAEITDREDLCAECRRNAVPQSPNEQ